MAGVGVRMAGDDSSSSSSATPASDDGQRKNARTLVADEIDDDDDELFELDIALLDGGHRGRCCSAAAADDDDHAAGPQHALLANCLLPVRSVSSAVPVDATSDDLSSTPSYPYSGYHGSRRIVLFTGGAVGRRFFLGRPAGHGSSARFCFSSRGFETYFQRY